MEQKTSLASSTPSTPFATTPLIALQAVSFSYSKRVQPVFPLLDWQLYPGETWAVLGASGSGKTTLLYLLMGLVSPTAGRIVRHHHPTADNKPDPPIHNASSSNACVRDTGLMLQDYGLLPWYTAIHNVRLGLQLRGMSKRHAQAQAHRWLERLDIAQLANRYPNQLSGGQKQRVALARLLVLEPTLMLLDEPLAAVDERTRERLQRLLYAITRNHPPYNAAATTNTATTTNIAQHGRLRTTVIVTHSVEEAALLATHVLILTPHQPIVLQSSLHPHTMPKRTHPDVLAFTTRMRQALGYT